MGNCGRVTSGIILGYGFT